LRECETLAKDATVWLPWKANSQRSRSFPVSYCIEDRCRNRAATRHAGAVRSQAIRPACKGAVSSSWIPPRAAMALWGGAGSRIFKPNSHSQSRDREGAVASITFYGAVSSSWIPPRAPMALWGGAGCPLGPPRGSSSSRSSCLECTLIRRRTPHTEPRPKGAVSSSWIPPRAAMVLWGGAGSGISKPDSHSQSATVRERYLPSLSTERYRPLDEASPLFPERKFAESPTDGYESASGESELSTRYITPPQFRVIRVHPAPSVFICGGLCSRQGS
jgi:hypothetical protein